MKAVPGASIAAADAGRRALAMARAALRDDPTDVSPHLPPSRVAVLTAWSCVCLHGCVQVGALLDASRALLDMGDVDRAAHAARAALSLAPERPELHFMLGVRPQQSCAVIARPDQRGR